MMKKIALIFVMSILCMAGSANLFAQGKYGADSADCIKYLSYYSEYYKQKNYDEAMPNWRKAFKYCPPTANQNMLINGTALVRYMINKNKNNSIYKEALVDTLMQLHDLRAQYYPKYKATALNNKGLDMINYIQGDNKALYEGFTEIIKNNGKATKPQIFLFNLNAAVELYKSGVISTEDVIGIYEESMGFLEQIEAAAPSETISKIKSDVENIFITSKVASCENLLALFTPRYEADPTNYELASNIVKMMSVTEGCTDNDLFLKATNTMHSASPSFTSAYFLYRLYSSRADLSNAIKFMEEAIAYPESDDEQDSDYYYELAAFCFKNGQSAKAFEAAQKAVALDQDNDVTGKSYMLMGTIWGSQVCPGNEIERRAPYWVAVDYMQKAKNADETLAAEADKYISQYRSYFPQTAEAFMYDVTDGQSYTVSCGGMRATTTVRTQK